MGLPILSHLTVRLSPKLLSAGITTLERLTSCHLLFCFRSSSLPPKHVSHHVMSKRRVLTRRFQLDPFSRQRDRFIEVLPGVQVGLGEKQVAFRKAGVHPDGLLELGDLARPIACALIETAEVEGSLV